MAPLANLLVPLLLIATFSPAPIHCYVNRDVVRVQQEATNTSIYHTYIVLVEPPPSNANEDMYRHWYESFLPSSHYDDSGKPRLVYSYTEVFSGFAARLTDGELDAVAKKPGFVRAFRDQTRHLMTTHTPKFLGLRNGTGIWSDAGYGKGVIVGLLDTGIYAKHPSFDDQGIPPPPARWQGSCKATRCNNKLIGAKSFVGDDDSSDQEGHGTHTSSTVAGNFANGVSYHGMGAGTASGVAPGAHIAMYKVCKKGCDDSAIVAGLDAAIKDGVDVLSISIGASDAVKFDEDPIAIGAFSAISKGIVVVCAAGNEGPDKHSISNDAPWMLTVAAGSVDRSFDISVNLRNGKSIHGEGLTQVGNPGSKMYPLLYSEERLDCDYKSSHVVSEKIVVCEYITSRYEDIIDVVRSGAAGIVLFNGGDEGYTIQLEDYNSSSVVQVSENDGAVLRAYATSASNSTGAIFSHPHTLLGVSPAPVVASFSSRGPSIDIPGVLKPDILAPGLNILAAWPPKADATLGPFNIISGTSMATPHVSGVAALIKSLHPNWSPAAVKSAILTTSDVVNSTGGSILDEKHKKAHAYAMGAGHVNPARAADPGLVYDLGVIDYAGYICWRFGDRGLATIVRNKSLACAKLPKVKDVQLNYPTITVPLKSTAFTVNRTVTNVGPPTSTYTVKLDTPKSLTVGVTPNKLVFSKAGEKKIFTVYVSVSGKDVNGQRHVEGSLSWVSAKHVVRTPIIAVRNLPESPPSSLENF